MIILVQSSKTQPSTDIDRSERLMKENMWSGVDFDSTIRDFDFTRKAIREIHRVVYSGDFEDMDSDMIFAYLFREMELVSFKDFLKRYLYEHAKISIPFSQVGDEVYRDIIMNSFDETYTPHSFEPTTRRWSAIVKGWLTQDNVKRSTIFLLGFGLHMSSEDVSGFLTKVLKEEDFNPAVPEEMVYKYCYENSLPYIKAKELLDEKDRDDKIQQNEDVLYRHFDSLLLRAKQVVADIYNSDEELRDNKKWSAEDITSADLEKMICSGIPLTENGNLQKMSASLLAGHFSQKRMSRQRIDSLVKRQLKVERFDLITLLFFIYAQEQLDLEPEERCKNYMDETNAVLKSCHMMGLYPVNPYESFILMCLLSDGPLATYSEIWDLSYSQ